MASMQHGMRSYHLFVYPADELHYQSIFFEYYWHCRRWCVFLEKTCADKLFAVRFTARSHFEWCHRLRSYEKIRCRYHYQFSMTRVQIYVSPWMVQLLLIFFSVPRNNRCICYLGYIFFRFYKANKKSRFLLGFYQILDIDIIGPVYFNQLTVEWPTIPLPICTIL